jgi:hypothetical protein
MERRLGTYSLGFNVGNESVPQQGLVAVATNKEIVRVRVAAKSLLAASPSFFNHPSTGGDSIIGLRSLLQIFN